MVGMATRSCPFKYPLLSDSLAIFTAGRGSVSAAWARKCDHATINNAYMHNMATAWRQSNTRVRAKTSHHYLPPRLLAAARAGVGNHSPGPGGRAAGLALGGNQADANPPYRG